MSLLTVLSRPRSGPSAGATAEALVSCAQQAGTLGVELVDVAGDVEVVADRAVQQVATFAELQSAAAGVRAAAAEVVAASGEVTAGADSALECVDGSRSRMAEALTRIDELTSWVGDLGAQLEAVTSTLAGVSEVAGQIDRIARETHILALNARIEAARSGEAGKSFAVIADSVRTLSERTQGAAGDIAGTLRGLATPLHELQEQGRDAGRRAGDVLAGATAVDGALTEVGTVLGRVRTSADDISGLAVRVGEQATATGSHLDGLVEGATVTRDDLSRARGRLGSLLGLSETLLRATAVAGVETPDTPFIRGVQEAAAEVARLFEAELAAGRVSREELFDTDYRPVPGSDPQQVTTRFTELTDRLVPPVQEPLLDLDERVVFAAAIDRNGYLPTHNRKFSQPQGRDATWNAANCRNRRIFDDRTGLSGARSTEPFLLQTYRRDMGGGTYALMKDVSAPVWVGGAHWGAVRMGYKV